VLSNWDKNYHREKQISKVKREGLLPRKHWLRDGGATSVGAQAVAEA